MDAGQLPVLEARNVPRQISAEHQERFNSKPPGQFDNRALLHDLDSRFENQDRMINYILQQVSSLESNVTGSSRLVRNLQEKDRDSILKMANESRTSADHLVAQFADLSFKFQQLQANQEKDAQMREELRHKLRVSES